MMEAYRAFMKGFMPVMGGAVAWGTVIAIVYIVGADFLVQLFDALMQALDEAC